jgi:hypothetical protein
LRFATISSAFDLALPPGNSAAAIARAEAVRFSMRELAADSERSNTTANGAISPLSSASKRMIAWLASSISARAAGGSVRFKSAIAGVIAAW